MNKRIHLLFDLPSDQAGVSLQQSEPAKPTQEEIDAALSTLRRGGVHFILFDMDELTETLALVFEQLEKNSDDFFTEEEVSAISSVFNAIESGEITAVDVEKVYTGFSRWFYVTVNQGAAVYDLLDALVGASRARRAGDNRGDSIGSEAVPSLG